MQNEPNHLLSARTIAAEVLSHFDIRKHDASARLDKLMDKTDQRARATDIVHGVIRNLSAIDYVLQHCAKVSKEHTDKRILALLRIGTYELLFVPQTPEYAILNDAVNLAGKKNKKASGFVNAVLRNIQRAIAQRSAPLSGQSPRKILPIDLQTGCLFNKDILPVVEEDLAVFLATAFSLPIWLVRLWLTDFGPQQTKQICFACNRHPSVILRPNLLKCTAEQLLQRLQNDGIEVSLLTDGTGLRLNQTINIITLSAYQEGLFFVQDQSAFDATTLLPEPKGTTILDLCAAPGTKTAALACRMGHSGRIYATDIDKIRLQKVQQNCIRLGITNVTIIEPEHLAAFLEDNPVIDTVITDVPCSNTGVLARRVEARWRLDEKHIAQLAKTQTDILHQAISCVRPGGHVLYSTCSIQKQENQALIQTILSQTEGCKLLKDKLTVPQTETLSAIDHDGGYASLILKT